MASAAPVKGIPPDTHPDSSSVAMQSHDQIRDVVAAFVQQQTVTLPGNITFQINEIDKRIALSKCTRLEAFLPAGSKLMGKTSVGVRCMEVNGWSILVQVQIKVSQNLLVSARQLPLGHILQKEDIASQTMETSQTAGLTDPGSAIGKVLRYGIGAGQVLREDMLRPPYNVTQGQVVQLAVQGSGFSIRNEGVALNNASEGQKVQIRTSSGRVISGIAGADGIVKINP